MARLPRPFGLRNDDFNKILDEEVLSPEQIQDKNF